MPNRTSFKSNKAYNAYFRAYRLKNQKKHRLYMKKYNRQYRKERGYAYEIALKKKYEKEHPVKASAQRRARYAIKIGKIKKLPCKRCGSKNVIAHHENYRKPLVVIFLCRAHHREIHYGKRK